MDCNILQAGIYNRKKMEKIFNVRAWTIFERTRSEWRKMERKMTSFFWINIEEFNEQMKLKWLELYSHFAALRIASITFARSPFPSSSFVAFHSFTHGCILQCKQTRFYSLWNVISLTKAFSASRIASRNNILYGVSAHEYAHRTRTSVWQHLCSALSV